MKYPERKHARLSPERYHEGHFYVTVCTKNKLYYFGQVKKECMVYTELGKCVDASIANAQMHYADVKIPVYVVMPNHFHAYIILTSEDGASSHQHARLGVVVGGIKAAVKRFANKNNLEFSWQESFYDHIVRDEADSSRIIKYIEANIEKWDSDDYR